MACTFNQADFGPPFSELDADIFEMFLETATTIVLGPLECQATTEAAWRRCCVDPCQAIKLLTKHLISSDDAIEDTDKDVLSERVGDVAVTYANISTSNNPFSDTTYGRAFGFLLQKYALCSSRRKRLPPAIPPIGGCGCG